MFNAIERFFKLIDVVFNVLTALTLGSMTLIIFAQVICRYVFESPLAWSEELARYLFIAMTFFAGYLAARQGKQIGVEALQNALPAIPRKILVLLSHLICVGFFGIVVYFITTNWAKFMTQTSAALGIEIAWVYLPMAIGSAFMMLWYLFLAVKTLVPQADKLEKEDA